MTTPTFWDSLRTSSSSQKGRGVEREGRGGVSDGCLEGESELQVQLVSSCSGSKEHAVHLFALHRCSVLVEAVSTSLETPLHPTAKVLNRSSGTCELVSQGATGYFLNRSSTELLVYSVRCSSLAETGLLFSLFSHDGFESKEPTLIGRASLLPQHFLSRDLTHGNAHLTILSPDLQPKGTLYLTYLLIHPLKMQDTPSVYSAQQPPGTSWRRSGRTLNIGHRGLGDSYQKNEELNPDVTENTVTSFRLASESGADYVEFDVQLTRDLVPIVFHDFKACVSLLQPNPSPPGHVSLLTPNPSPPGHGGQMRCKVLVRDLSLEELRCLKLEHSSVMEDTSLNPGGRLLTELAVSGCGAAGSVGVASPDEAWFPTLEEVLQRMPEGLGFNIEVKYPVPEIQNQDYDFPYFDRNKMADQILEVVYKHARGRKIILSCFDADMCTVLCLKQPHFPVLFLTINGSTDFPNSTPVDLRAQTIRDALMHAQAQNLQGINIDSYQLKEEPEWVAEVTEKRKMTLFTWGKSNNGTDHLNLQRSLGVDGFIYDRIDLLLPGSRTNPQKQLLEHEL